MNKLKLCIILWREWETQVKKLVKDGWNQPIYNLIRQKAQGFNYQFMNSLFQSENNNSYISNVLVEQD